MNQRVLSFRYGELEDVRRWLAGLAGNVEPDSGELIDAIVAFQLVPEPDDDGLFAVVVVVNTFGAHG